MADNSGAGAAAFVLSLSPFFFGDNDRSGPHVDYFRRVHLIIMIIMTVINKGVCFGFFARFREGLVVADWVFFLEFERFLRVFPLFEKRY